VCRRKNSREKCHFTQEAVAAGIGGVARKIIFSDRINWGTLKKEATQIKERPVQPKLKVVIEERKENTMGSIKKRKDVFEKNKIYLELHFYHHFDDSSSCDTNYIRFYENAYRDGN
jgi:hypothetical protein